MPLCSYSRSKSVYSRGCVNAWPASAGSLSPRHAKYLGWKYVPANAGSSKHTALNDCPGNGLPTNGVEMPILPVGIAYSTPLMNPNDVFPTPNGSPPSKEKIGLMRHPPRVLYSMPATAETG